MHKFSVFRKVATLALLITTSAFRTPVGRSSTKLYDSSKFYASKGFGSTPEPGNKFPSIDALANDPEILIRDRRYQATMPTKDIIENGGKGQFGEDREKKFDFNDLEFPCEFTLKVIGVDDESFKDDMLSLCKKVTSQKEAVKHAIKLKGRYLSLTVTPMFTDGEQIYTLYERLHSDARVRFVL